VPFSVSRDITHRSTPQKIMLLQGRYMRIKSSRAIVERARLRRADRKGTRSSAKLAQGTSFADSVCDFNWAIYSLHMSAPRFRKWESDQYVRDNIHCRALGLPRKWSPTSNLNVSVDVQTACRQRTFLCDRFAAGSNARTQVVCARDPVLLYPCVSAAFLEEFLRGSMAGRWNSASCFKLHPENLTRCMPSIVCCAQSGLPAFKEVY